MGAKYSIDSRRDSSGRLVWVKITKNRKFLELNLDYDSETGYIKEITVEGAKTLDFPTFFEMAELIGKNLVDIKSSSGTNIIIDKLTQAAYTERRSTLSNDPITLTWWAPNGNDRRGKFFPRGARGFIKTIDVRCKDAGTGGGTISVYISPHPSMGYVATANITVPAAAADTWRSATFNIMWNYDSLFIWFSTSGSEIQGCYESAEPKDGWGSNDGAATWWEDSTRWGLRVVMIGETVGDVPVSGTINTIEIPNIIGDISIAGYANIDGGETTVIFSTIYGAGKVTALQFDFSQVTGTVPANFMRLYLIIDGVTWTIAVNLVGQINANQAGIPMPISIALWDTTNNRYTFGFNFPIPFKRSFGMTVENLAAAGNRMTVYRLAAYETIS